MHNDCAFQASSPKTFMAGLVPAFFCPANSGMARRQSLRRHKIETRRSGAAGETGTGETIARGIERHTALPRPLD
jgi:hypothetical protein